MNAIPRSEHPRPRLRRANWLSLNGRWRFTFDPRLIGEQERWYRTGLPPQQTQTILVPFPWESPLSEVTAPDYKGAGWYEREITIPSEWKGHRVRLHFGAVDWSARVWLNGRFLIEHENGYLPFHCDISKHLRPGERGRLTVRAFDISDPTNPVGKQVPRWYTPSSGIWQSVWLEAIPHVAVESIYTRADLEEANVALTLALSGLLDEGTRFRISGEGFEEQRGLLVNHLNQGRLSLQIPIAEPLLWSPDQPHLYPLHIEISDAEGPTDRVESYFGLRTIERARWGSNEYESILLNGEPIYLRGALDQALHPAGLHTYPSDDVLRSDIELAKEFGLNMLRCHIKINEPRYYYWADQLGLLIMYDLPSPDLDTPRMRRTWEETLRGALERDGEHPSIFAWVLFNETWGLDHHDGEDSRRWLQQMVHLTRDLDPTRLVEDNSPCLYDHVESDINSWHFYINDYEKVRRHVEHVVGQTYPGSAFNYVGGEFVQGTAPLMNSEYGGIAARSGDLDVSWCFKYQTTELRRHEIIQGYVYTELSDIEWEHNGFVNYDRTPKAFGYDAFVSEMNLADLNGPDLVGFDAPPCITLAPGSIWEAPLFASHYGLPMHKARVAFRLDFVDRFGEARTMDSGHIPLDLKRFCVTTLEPLRLQMPNEPGLVTVSVRLVDSEGEVRSRNYVNIEVYGERSPRSEVEESLRIQRFSPGDFSAGSWDNPALVAGGAKFSATGAGWVEYQLDPPGDGAISDLTEVQIRCELGSRAGRVKIDWPQQLGRENYPQTEPLKRLPSDVTVSLSGEIVAQIRVSDDPADARGVLSHHRGVDPGSYGELQIIRIRSEVLDGIRYRLEKAPLILRFEVAADAEFANGLALYGERMGRYPLDPSVIWRFT